MADDPRKHKHDRKLISLKQPHERRAWPKRFGVTFERLQYAVVHVGPSVAKVRVFLLDDPWARGENL